MAPRKTTTKPPSRPARTARAKAPDDGLEELSKKDLVTRAETLAIDGAAKFTKVELVDEIRRAQGERERGFVGRARQLLEGVVSSGLARALRGEAAPPPRHEATPPRPPSDVTPVASLTLAQIYLAQGYVVRAKNMTKKLIEENPDDAEARALLRAIEERRASTRVSGPTPTPPSSEEPAPISVSRAAESVPPPISEPAVTLKEAGAGAGAGAGAEVIEPPSVPLPAVAPPALERVNADECVALAVDPSTLYVYWETRPASVIRATRAIEGAEPALRVLVVVPDLDGPRSETRDYPVTEAAGGELFVRDLPEGAILRAAIGVRNGTRFLPIAHTTDVEPPRRARSNNLARDVVVYADRTSSHEWSRPVAVPSSGGAHASGAGTPSAHPRAPRPVADALLQSWSANEDASDDPTRPKAFPAASASMNELHRSPSSWSR